MLKTTIQKLYNDQHMETNFDEMYDKYKDYDFADAKPVTETPLLSELQANHHMNTLNYKGYTTKIEFDAVDNILFGNIIGIRDTVGFHGNSMQEFVAAFHEAVDFYLESCEKLKREPNQPLCHHKPSILP